MSKKKHHKGKKKKPVYSMEKISKPMFNGNNFSSTADDPPLINLSNKPVTENILNRIEELKLMMRKAGVGNRFQALIEENGRLRVQAMPVMEFSYQENFYEMDQSDFLELLNKGLKGEELSKIAVETGKARYVDADPDPNDNFEI